MTYWVGMGVTIIDLLDTLYIMGMEQEFARARRWVAEELSLHKVSHTISVFESIIRIVGGLLSAFDLSNDPMFLVKAKQLTDRLLMGFYNNNKKAVFVCSRRSAFHRHSDREEQHLRVGRPRILPRAVTLECALSLLLCMVMFKRIPAPTVSE